MRIEMIKTRRQTSVPEKVGRVLIDKGIAVEVGSAPAASRQTYLTRDLRADPSTIPTFAPPGTPIGEVQAVVVGEDFDPLDDAPVALAGPELDSEGQPWSPDLHTIDRAMTRAGTWRKKPGAKASA